MIHRHRLPHLGPLRLNDNLRTTRFDGACNTSRCTGTCCRRGVRADLLERERILAQAQVVIRHMEPGQQHDPRLWFETTTVRDGDYPSGVCVGTELFNGACVFLDSAGRCVLQKASDAHTGMLKPFFCFAFPITLDRGELLLDRGSDPACCIGTADGHRNVFDACAVELVHVLGEAGTAELKGLLNPAADPPR